MLRLRFTTSMRISASSTTAPTQAPPISLTGNETGNATTNKLSSSRPPFLSYVVSLTMSCKVVISSHVLDLPGRNLLCLLHTYTATHVHGHTTPPLLSIHTSNIYCFE